MEQKEKDKTVMEETLAKQLGTRYCVLANSYGYACEAAFRALCATLLGERAILPEDEVILSHACDHVMIEAVRACGATPVLLDMGRGERIDVSCLENALSPRTRAVAVQHVGGLFDAKTVRNFCNKYDLWMVENARSWLGEPYDFDGVTYGAGTIGDVGVSTYSAYVPSDGVVLTRDTTLDALIREAYDDMTDVFMRRARTSTKE